MPDAASPSGLRFVMWGPSSAGKTMFLVQLFLQARGRSEWLVRPTSEAVTAEVERNARRMREHNMFPAPTALGDGADLSFSMINDRTGERADISIKDRAGEYSERLDSDNFGLFRAADAVLLMFDHTRETSRLLTETQLTLMKLYTDRQSQPELANPAKDPRPVAVCLTKTDLLVRTPGDAQRARDTPDAFVRERLDRRVVDCVEEHCRNAQFFPVSSVGLRVRHGGVEPVLFLDEELSPRIGHFEEPINLIQPFEWLFREARAARAERQPSS
jgi:hypothetical protein